MTYATTFSGIGGWEIGLNACGWDLQWQCECEPFCQALLKERFGVPIYGDIRTLAEANPPKVDALIGSPPCPPFSVAGARLGVADTRHLYPSFLSTVRRIRPRWVLMEQVAGLLSANNGRAFGIYIAGLASLGYDLVWHCIPVCAVGANHERDRVWIIAHALRGSGAQGDSSQSQGEVPRGKDSPNLDRARFQERFVRGGIQGQERCNPFWEDTSLDPAWAFESPLVRRLHGISNRVDSIRALGNAVYPKIPEIIGQAINEVEKG